MIDRDTQMIIGAIITAVVAAVWLGYALAYRTIRMNAIQQECAHYDTRTGEFKWGNAQ